MHMWGSYFLAEVNALPAHEAPYLVPQFDWMGQGFSLAVTLQLTIASFPGLDTTLASNVRLFYPPLPVSHRRGASCKLYHLRGLFAS